MDFGFARKARPTNRQVASKNSVTVPVQFVCGVIFLVFIVDRVAVSVTHFISFEVGNFVGML
jgi:hypothetical protein